ncbi:MAG TPA: hypothetical protein VK421_04635 [Pyrinomonadaceae bacterium]|nr:hypothetical protein [Pyrinomonadaceae bacterium]
MNQHAEQFDSSTAEARAQGPAAGRDAEPRIYGLFPAQVRGVDSSGAQFHTQTLLDNFGATEFDLRLPRCVAAGSELLVVTDIHDATVALHGNVLRAERQEDGAYRLTVAVTHHRFL